VSWRSVERWPRGKRMLLLLVAAGERSESGFAGFPGLAIATVRTTIFPAPAIRGVVRGVEFGASAATSGSGVRARIAAISAQIAAVQARGVQTRGIAAVSAGTRESRRRSVCRKSESAAVGRRCSAVAITVARKSRQTGERRRGCHRWIRSEIGLNVQGRLRGNSKSAGERRGSDGATIAHG